MTLKVGDRLFTKDGRRVGNGIVTGISEKVSVEDSEVYSIETDFGNVMALFIHEVEEFYYTDWEPDPDPYMKHTLEEWFESRARNIVPRVLKWMRTTDSIVATVWDMLVDQGWVPPKKPTDAISLVVRLLQLDKGPEGFEWINRKAEVSGEDFTYVAQVLCSFPKTNGKVRYVVEDRGRLFIQRDAQIKYMDGKVSP